MDKALAADHFLCRSQEYRQTMAVAAGAGIPATQINKNSNRSKSQMASPHLASRDLSGYVCPATRPWKKPWLMWPDPGKSIGTKKNEDQDELST